MTKNDERTKTLLGVVLMGFAWLTMYMTQETGVLQVGLGLVTTSGPLTQRPLPPHLMTCDRGGPQVGQVRASIITPVFPSTPATEVL